MLWRIYKLNGVYTDVSVHCKKTKQTTDRQRNFCCIKTKKNEPNLTFRHIWPPKRTGKRFAAKRAFIFPTLNN